MALDGVLANIPGLAGYTAMQDFQQRQSLGGLQGTLSVLQAVEQQKQRELQQQMLNLQIQKATREADFQKSIQGLITGQMPGGAGGVTAPGGVGTAPAGRLNPAALGLALSGLPGGPTAANMLNASTDPGKVTWRDEGGRLVPVYENTGQSVPNLGPITKTIAPGDQATLTQREFQFNNLSADQRARAGVQGARLEYETGMPAPALGPQPTNATPMQVPPQVQAARDQTRMQLLQNELRDAMAKGDANAVAELQREIQVVGKQPTAVAGLPLAERNKATREGLELANKDFVEKSFRPTLSDAQSARQSNTLIDAYRSLPLSQRTGWGTQAMATAANVLTGMGIAPDRVRELASDSQMFNNLAMQQNWQMLMEQKGPQTEGDAQRARQVFAQLGNTPEANEFIWDFTKAMNDQKIERARFYQSNYDAAKRSGDLSSIESAWADKSQGWSLFDQPSMKKWKDRGAAAGAPTRISTDAEYSALPKGAVYIAPDGKTRTKQ